MIVTGFDLECNRKENDDVKRNFTKESTMQPFIGVIADTHGLLRPAAIAALQGATLIVHAGDVGKAEILDELQSIAPLYAIRGNVDKGDWAEMLPATDVVAYGAHLLYVLHDLAELALTPAVAGFHAVISGHSHQPMIEERDRVLYFNPGSAGPRRFTLPITVGKLTVVDNTLHAEIIELA